jgi:hypothetical protein
MPRAAARGTSFDGRGGFSLRDGEPTESDRMLMLSPSLLLGAQSASAPLLLEAAAAGGSPLATLADFAAALPAPLRGPDATPSLPTGASEISRADAFTYAALAGVPRLTESLGPLATGVIVGDDAFALAETYEDAASGFRAVQFRSFTDGRTVFAVDGTDFSSVADVLADLNLARPQASSPAFAAMVADARTAAVAEGREVAFTGASLGGALAQVGGYEVAEAILAASPGYAGRVTVFGVDPLGGRDAAESANAGRLDPAVLERMNALHVRADADVVSRVGSHLGGTLSFQAVDALGNPVLLSAEDAHVNVESLLATLSSDALFAAGVRGDPVEIGGLALLANAFGPVLADALAYLDVGATFGQPEPASLPGSGGLDPTGRFYDVDADSDGDTDLRVLFGGAAPVAGDLLLIA